MSRSASKMKAQGERRLFLSDRMEKTRVRNPIRFVPTIDRSNIRVMGEKDAKAIYKSLYKKTLKVKQGSHFCWLFYFGNLKKSFIESSPEITLLFINRGYDISTAYND